MPRDTAVGSVMGTIVRATARALIVAVLLGTFSAGLAACGQRGPLYLPDKDNPDKRR